MARVVMNPNFKPELEDELNRKLGPVINSVADSYAGRPVDEVAAALMAALKRAGVDPNRDGVREMAEAISASDASS